jgi:hypothetical protein
MWSEMLTASLNKQQQIISADINIIPKVKNIYAEAYILI